VDGYTHGRKRLTPSEFRRLARAHSCRGGSCGDIVTVLERLRIPYRYAVDRTREQARRLLARPGSLAYVPIDYEQLPRDERCQSGEVDFYHAMGIVTGEQDGQYRTMDPLCHGRHLIEVNELLTAAIGYGREHSDGRTLDLVLVESR
jgi:hypothetical protein